jgi:hypothetical protein
MPSGGPSASQLRRPDSPGQAASHSTHSPLPPRPGAAAQARRSRPGQARQRAGGQGYPVAHDRGGFFRIAGKINHDDGSGQCGRRGSGESGGSGERAQQRTRHAGPRPAPPAQSATAAPAVPPGSPRPTRTLDPLGPSPALVAPGRLAGTIFRVVSTENRPAGWGTCTAAFGRWRRRQARMLGSPRCRN